MSANIEVGYFLSSEEFAANDLVRQAVLAEEHGFRRLWISDHYHPWLASQGHSPFVWNAIGGIAAATYDVHLTTAVTCPTMRIHPAIVAQAAATSASMLNGRFALGVGTGENLNEHILGDTWPDTDTRLEMLEEAVAIMRRLWAGGVVSHRGQHYRVVNARVYETPPQAIPVAMSAFGPKAVSLAARIADAYLVSAPLGDLVTQYRDQDGEGPVLGGVKVCYDEDEQRAVAIAYERWRNEALPGELAQELSMPAHFEQATQLVDVDTMRELFACGPDPERHAAAIREYAEAGFDTVCVQQIGGNHERFFGFYRDEVLPRL